MNMTRLFVVRIWQTMAKFPDEKEKLRILHPAAFTTENITADVKTEISSGQIRFYYRTRKVATLEFGKKSGHVLPSPPPTTLGEKNKEELKQYFERFKKWRTVNWTTEPGYEMDYYSGSVRFYCRGTLPEEPPTKPEPQEPLTAQAMLDDMEQLIRCGLMKKERVRERLTTIK